MNKIKKDGEVAVLYSPGYGAGWSTWNDSAMRYTLCMDANIVQAVLDKDINTAIKIAEQKFPGRYVCVSGAKQLRIEWIPEGCSFEIEEYDGSESIHIIGTHDSMVA